MLFRLLELGHDKSNDIDRGKSSRSELKLNFKLTWVTLRMDAGSRCSSRYFCIIS